jgi:hypothetical protein
MSTIRAYGESQRFMAENARYVDLEDRVRATATAALNVQVLTMCLWLGVFPHEWVPETQLYLTRKVVDF